MTKPKPITFTVRPEDAEKAGEYVDHHNCLLCTAAKRELGRDDITASSQSMTIGGATLTFDDAVFRRIHRAYGPDYLDKPAVKKAFKVTLTHY